MATEPRVVAGKMTFDTPEEAQAWVNKMKPPEVQASESASETQTESSTPSQPGPLKKSFLSRAREFVDVAKEDITGKTKKERELIAETKRIKQERAAEKARDEALEETEESSEEKSSKKKGKKDDMEDMFGDDEDVPRSRGRRPSPVGTYESAYQHNKPVPYESAYAGKNVMSGHFQEAYIGKGMANGVYKSPGNPKTYDMSRGEPQQRQSPPRPPQPTPAPQRARTSMPMPTIGSFGNGNIKMPTISLGGYGKVSNAHKMGPGNMPSINIPTLGGSTLLPTMGKKMGKFDIPTIGNWGKAPLKSKLETPSIGNLTIMGAGKGGMGFGLGEVPRFGLAAPGKRKNEREYKSICDSSFKKGFTSRRRTFGEYDAYGEA